jgi:hypothetical protein
VESKLRNTNVWAGNLQLATLPNYLNNVNTSLVNNFEYSRLWNQKRMYFTLISKFSDTKLAPQSNLVMPNGATLDYNHLTNLALLDYCSFKSNASLFTMHYSLDSSGVKNANASVFLSSANLNAWNTIDKALLFNLCTSDNTSNKTTLYYDLASYSKIYTNI